MVTWLDNGVVRLGFRTRARQLRRRQDQAGATGLGRLTRRFSLAPHGYTLDLTAVNVSGRVVRWALWNVTQFPGGGDVVVALRDHPAPVVNLVAGTGNPRWSPVDGGALVAAQDIVGKLGFPGAACTLTYTHAGLRTRSPP